MGHLPKLSQYEGSKMSLPKSTLIFVAIIGLAVASAVEDKECTHFKGCSDTVECCNKQFHCVRGPNQEGVCAPWLPLLNGDQKDCVVHRGCQKPSDCCNKQFTCAHFAGQDEGVCMPWLMKEEKECVADFEHGCATVDGSDCCNEDFMCINGRCQSWVPILRPHPHHRGTTRKPATRHHHHPHHHKATTRKMVTTPRPATHKPHHHHHHHRQVGAQCQSTSDCPKLHMFFDGTCRPKFMEVEGKQCQVSSDCPSRNICQAGKCKPVFMDLMDLLGRRNVGCPKCKTVADCPKYAHCGFNGCCQFW